MAREVLLLVEAEIATVQLVRRLLRHLDENADFTWRDARIDEVTAADLRPGMFPLIVRSCEAETVALASSFVDAGIPYGYYIDDNFWKLEPDSDLGVHYGSRVVRRDLEQIVRDAEIVIAATEPLRDFLAAYTDRAVQLDSFYDFTLAPAELPPAPDRELVRGGFAASRFRGDDLAVVMPAVLDALDRHENLEFEIIGAELPEYAGNPRIRWFPYEKSYEAYTRFQLSRAWDFGLAPLGGAESNLYKTDNKFREYAALGIPGVYADALPYHAVRDGETGLLAGVHRTWHEAIELYCSEPHLRRRIRANARADARARVSIENVAPLWGEVFAAAPGIGDDPEIITVFAEGLDRRRHRIRRGAGRLVSLGHAAGEELRRNGLGGLAIRSVRFVGKRLRLIKPVEENGLRDLEHE